MGKDDFVMNYFSPHIFFLVAKQIFFFFALQFLVPADKLNGSTNNLNIIYTSIYKNASMQNAS